MKISKFIFLSIIIIGILHANMTVSSENNLLNTAEYNKSIEAYHEILKDMEMIKKIFIENYYYDNDYIFSDDFDYYFNIDNFTILDMDGDNIPEIILATLGMLGDMLMLHYDNGTVYGYTFPLRGFKWIKKDGTFNWSGGAAYGGFDKLQFINGVCQNKTLGYSDEYLFYINDKQVSEKEFYLFCDEQNKKEDADWYEFNETNIENVLTPILVAPKTEDTSVIFVIIIFALSLVCFKRLKKIRKSLKSNR